MSNNQSTSGGIGFFGLLCILFIGLKLTGNIDWSWLWVLSPLWIPVAAFFAILGIFGVLMSLVKIFDSLFSKRRHP